MAFLKYKNRAVSTLDGGINDSVGSLDVATGEGSLFPTSGDFHITVEDEIMNCTAIAGDTLTVTRGAESTTPAAHSDAVAVELRITAGVLENLQTLLADADGDTQIQVEESADEDIIRMDTAGTEVFNLDAIGELTLAKQSKARGHLNTNATISTLTYTKVNLDDEDFDSQNEFDSSTNYRFTATNAGYYLVCASAIIADLADGTRWAVAIYLNGAIYSSTQQYVGAGTAYPAQVCLDVINLSATDYVELYVFHNHGSDRTMVADASRDFLTVHRLS